MLLVSKFISGARLHSRFSRKMAAGVIETKVVPQPHSQTAIYLSLHDRSLPPALPLIISTQDSWNPHSCKLETTKTDTQDQLVEGTLELLHSIDKPLAILSICGPYHSGKSYFMSRLLGSPGNALYILN